MPIDAQAELPSNSPFLLKPRLSVEPERYQRSIEETKDWYHQLTQTYRLLPRWSFPT